MAGMLRSIAQRPSQNPHAAEGLIAMILEVMDNKDIWKAQIAELQAQREQCNAAFKQANDAIADANARTAAADQRAAEVNSRDAERTAALDAREADIARREKAMADLAASLRRQVPELR